MERVKITLTISMELDVSEHYVAKVRDLGLCGIQAMEEQQLFDDGVEDYIGAMRKFDNNVSVLVAEVADDK